MEIYGKGGIMIEDMFLVFAGLFVFLGALIIVFVLCIFFYIMRKLVNSSEYPRISEIFPSASKPEGKVFYRQYLALNGIWFKNSANLVITDKGLYISFGFPLSLTISQAVLIPWSYLRYQQKKRAFWTDVYEYVIILEDPVVMTVMKQVAESFPEDQKQDSLYSSRKN
jgi:hypothetical protein